MESINKFIELVNADEPLDYDDFYEKFRLNLRYHFAERLNLPIAKPHWVYISLTNNCTYKCHMCGVIKQDQTTSLSSEKIKQLIDEIASWKSDQIITFTGGEVFLRKDLFSLIDYALSKNVKTEIISNGSLIDEKKAKWLIHSNLQSVNISLDGSKAEIHDRIRNARKAFELTTRAIKYLVKYKRENDNKGPQLSVWTTIQKWNINDLMNITRLVESYGIDKHILHPIILNQCDMQKEANVKNNPLWPDDKDIELLKGQVEKMIEYEKKKGLIAFLHDPHLFIQYFQGNYNRRAWKCNPFQFINLGPDGKVQICGDSFGNIKENTIEQAYSSEKAAEHRSLMKKCSLNCLQTCWARPESDVLENIFSNFTQDLEKEKLSKKERKEYLEKAREEIDRYNELINLITKEKAN